MMTKHSFICAGKRKDAYTTVHHAMNRDWTYKGDPNHGPDRYTGLPACDCGFTGCDKPFDDPIHDLTDDELVAEYADNAFPFLQECRGNRRQEFFAFALRAMLDAGRRRERNA